MLVQWKLLELWVQAWISALGLIMPNLEVLSKKITGTKPVQKPVKSNSENDLT